MQDYGYRVPEDISVIGFDDRPVCQMIVPSVTTVNVPKNAFGAAAVELLMEKNTESKRVFYENRNRNKVNCQEKCQETEINLIL